MVNGPKDNRSSLPAAAALTGLLFILPFAALNTVVANRVEPFFSMIRPGVHTSPREYVLLAIVLLLIPVGALAALRPSLQKDTSGRRRFYLVNCAIAALLAAIFVAISSALGSEIYACEVLQTPNCD